MPSLTPGSRDRSGTRLDSWKEIAAYLRRDFPGINICFFGHTHEQRIFEVDEERVVEVGGDGPVSLRPDRIYFVNPGSVDASRKRASKLAEYALFDSDTLTVQFETVAYDDVAAEHKAAMAGYRIDRWRDRLYDVQRRLVGPRHVESGAPATAGQAGGTASGNTDRGRTVFQIPSTPFGQF